MNSALRSRVIIASNRLPVKITEEGGEPTLTRSLGGLATALASVFEKQDSFWVGWPDGRHKLSKAHLKKLGFPERLVPVPITARQLHRYYDRLSNGVLWPIMHGLPSTQPHSEADWEAARQVTQKFVRAIKSKVRPGDVIWVHDYHLVLLPQLLREAGVDNRIGFFLHTPFPLPEVLTGWRERHQLLKSLSHVDVLGFQTPRDVRNFRTSLAAAGMKMREGAVVEAFPIGVDFARYQAAGKRREARRHAREIGKKTAGKRTILSVSRLDYTKGIIEQLRAYERLLETHKKPETMLYKLIVAPSREGIRQYRQLKNAIDKTVNAINARFGNTAYQPIEYTYRSHGFDEVSAWFRAADVLLVASHIDGMNLVAKEYVAARDDDRGIIVLSETAGASFQLGDAVLVDPGDIMSITAGLKKALQMPARERRKRWAKLRENVERENVFWWTDQFLSRLRQS